MSMNQVSEPIKSNKILFDKVSIIHDIEKKKEYKEGNTIIKRWDGNEENANMYCAKIKNEDTYFLGILNDLFQRNGYCVNKYSNGDSYFGYYSDDLRDKHGFYEFKPKIKNKIRNQEFYFGLWNNDQRNNRGINLWISEPAKNIPFSDFESANFGAYVGLFENNNYKKGTFLSKNEDDYFVYHGYFDSDGNRNGDNCLFYSSTKEQCLYGEFIDNQFDNGYICKYDDNGNVNDLCKFEEDEIINEEDLDEKLVHDICLKLHVFRNVIMEKDYFGELYNAFGKAYNFKNNEMNDIDILNNDKYLDIMTAAIIYNKISIFNDIEKFVF